MAGDVDYHQSQGRIDRLEVENFKSYRGHQHIGPFKAFTAVIGPNGSGKSNLMDAISFVLGVKTTQLRGSLKELLYSNTDSLTQAQQPRRGFVKLVYIVEETGPEGGPAAERELHFARHIVPTSSDPDAPYKSEYRVNDRVVTWDAYSRKLGSMGILVKVRNFLVFQGDIEAVASKSPAGLTQLFEQISGSEALKARYEELAEAKVKAEEKVSLLYGRRKQVQAELKAKKREKEDAEAHARKLEEMRSARSALAVWQLAVEGRELEAALTDRRAAEEALAGMQSSLKEEDSKAEAHRRALAGLKKDLASAEKRLKKLQQDKDKKSPALLKAKEELARVQRAQRTGQRAVTEAEAKVAAQEAKIEALEAQLQEQEEAESALQSEVDAHYSARAGRHNVLDSRAAQEEYARLKGQVGAATARPATERASLEAEQQATQEQLNQLVRSAEQLRQRAAQLAAQAEEAEARKGDAAEALKALRAELEDKGKARQRLQEEKTRTNTQRNALSAKVAELDERLAGLRLERAQGKREAAVAAMAEELKRRFPGSVFGKLVGLAKPIQARYQTALSVALQRDMDSVVVDSEATAKTCIQILRDEGKPTMNFIPLSFVKVRPLNERLRQLGGGAKLALDLLDIPDRRMERAFQFALEDTVICEDDTSARRLAYGGEQRLKVVSLDGTLITKRGTMTGGSASGEARGSRWDEAEAGRLGAELEEARRRLGALPEPRALADAEGAVAAEMGGLGSRAKYKEAEVKEAASKAASLAAQARKAGEDAAKLEPQVAELRKKLEARARKIQRLADEINGESDRLMADFSRRAGVSSIREWEEAHAGFEEGVAARRRDIATKKTAAESQLGYERGHLARLVEAAAAKATEVAEAVKRQAALEKELAGATAAAAGVEGEVEGVAKKMEELRAKVASEEGSLSGLQAAAGELHKRAARLREGARRAALGAEERAGRMLDLVQAARLEQVRLPERADGEEPMSADDDGASQAAARFLDLDDLVAGIGPAAEGGAGGAGEEGAEGSQGAELAAAMAGLVQRLDTSGLTRSQLAASSAREREKAEGELRAAVAALAAELEKAAPNMRAGEQYEAVRERDREQLAALHAAQAQSSATAEEFARVRSRRVQLFTTAFNHIADQISAIYKDLTRSPLHPLGGQAYLHVESEEEPFAGGVKYTAIPPAKRFRDMEQLSGGEKTVAALALLFAIHSFRPSPFFVLDEVDAALDATNVARVAHYIRARTRAAAEAAEAAGGGGGPGGGEEGGEGAARPHGFQSIVISLKDIFYEKADSLVGVCRDLDAGCSKTFTFDLSRFEEPLPDA